MSVSVCVCVCVLPARNLIFVTNKKKKMGNVFHERYPDAEIITSDFVNYADELVSLRQRLQQAASSASSMTEEAMAAAKAKAERGKLGTVVFNAVFGNLWDQRAALDSAAAILEV